MRRGISTMLHFYVIYAEQKLNVEGNITRNSLATEHILYKEPRVDTVIMHMIVFSYAT